MRYIFIVIIFSACQSKSVTNESRAIDSVKSYILRTINDPSGYQPISFDLDTLRIVYRNTPRGRLIQKENYDRLIFTSAILFPDIDQDSLKNIIDDNEAILSKVVVDSIQKGWTVDHDFRAKNSFGATILKHYRYKLDSNFSVISEEDSQWFHDIIEEGKYRREQARLDSIANSLKPKPDTINIRD